MNNETIKRSDALEAIKALHNILGDAGTKAAVMALEGVPAAGDAVEVVRCSKCKYGEIDEPDFPNQYYCHQGHMWNNREHFCADGKPRMDGE